jgi:hypothetical protein
MKHQVKLFLTKSTNQDYWLLEMRFLSGSFSSSPDVIGSIMFQRNVYDSKGWKWYGKKYHFESDRLSDIEKFVKIIRKVEKSDLYYDAQPQDIFNFLKCEEYGLWNFDWTPVAFNKYMCYKVRTAKTNMLYNCIYAKTEADANKQFQKFQENTTGEYNIIPFKQVSIGSVWDELKALDKKM